MNIGPGKSGTNQYHCLARNNNNGDTINVNTNIVDGCQQLKDYQDFAKCAEQGAHAYGHNGVGGVVDIVAVISAVSRHHICAALSVKYVCAPAAIKFVSSSVTYER